MEMTFRDEIRVAGVLDTREELGAPITETVFAWPGVGRLLVDSVIGGDYVVAQSVLMFLAVLVLIFNLMADLGYALLDPRIRYN